MELLNTRSQSLGAVVSAYSSKLLGYSEKAFFVKLLLSPFDIKRPVNSW